MATIGRILVPSIADSGLTFPLTSDMGYGKSQEWPVVVHRFGAGDAKVEQRYQIGIGPVKHAFRRQNLSLASRNQLFSFWESIQGSNQTFTYNVPGVDQTLLSTKVIWEFAPISAQYLLHACQVGFNFVEIPTDSPSYSLNGTCTRFPSAALNNELLNQVQQIIPLVHIRVREAAVPDIYVSDRSCAIGAQAYLPRLLNLGETGSDVIISQSLNGAADDVTFTFGNADRVMTLLANDTDLQRAEIDLSLYHVNSGILLQLWSGFISKFAINGGPLFTVKASDALSKFTQMYPTRSISRTCWKPFNDPILCPYSTQGSGGNPNSCDYYYDSANGCVSHNMTQFFGGIAATPQGVNIKDNSTGTWGLGRNNVTATSIVSDTLWGNALPEIWCNAGGDPTKALWVTAMIAAGRDESDFYDAIGIIGAGPIGGFTTMTVAQNSDGFRYIVAPLLDGQTPHGFKVDGSLNIKDDQPNMGLREINGTDPQTAPFGISSGGTVTGPPAAGVAFVEVRRTDQKGIQPTSPDSHSLQVPIDKGLSGWVWDASGTRSLVAGLTNPFWIAINSYLRLLGLQNASSTDQLNEFVLSSLVNADGTGAAQVADTLVNAVVGGGTEKQFTFQGTLSQQKPFRDWLNEILSTGLGCYTWEFGKLKLICRYNAQQTDLYSPDNYLFQSLSMEPVDPMFEHLIIDFADQAYQYQANIAEYQDKDHETYYGRTGSPLTSRIHSVGISSLSNGLRVAATRTREELGGINAREWRNARTAQWATTLLALNNEVGQVVGVASPDMAPVAVGTGSITSGVLTGTTGDPITSAMLSQAFLINGAIYYGASLSGSAMTLAPAPPDGTGISWQVVTGSFRIQSWQLRKDYSISLQGKTVTPSMYDLTVGVIPVETLPAPPPPLAYPIPLGQAWAPYQIQAPSFDALFSSEWNFDINESYASSADGTVLASLAVTGKLPTSGFSQQVTGAPTVGSITVNPTGGSIAGGQTLRVALCGMDNNGLLSGLSSIRIIQTPAGPDTCQIVLNGIIWPPVTSGSLASYVVFISPQDDLICEQQTGAIAASITVNGPLARSTWSMPSSYASKVRIKTKKLLHPGVAHGAVTAVATNSVTVGSLAGINRNYTGRKLSVIGRNGTSTPFLNLSITAYDYPTGTFTVSPQAVVAGQALQSVAVGDVVMVSFASSSITSSSVVDGLAGLTANAEIGNLIRVIAGKGRGTPPRKITANTTTQVTWDSSMTLDSTSVWVIEESTWSSSADSSTISNANPFTVTQFTIPVANYPNQAVLVSGFVVDNYGNESPDGDQPVRANWVYGFDSAVAAPPSGAQTGSNPTFTLPGTPASSASIEVFLNGGLQELGVDYTVSGTTITFMVSPRSTDYIFVRYK